MSDKLPLDYKGLRALFINCTLSKSPAVSNTQGVIDLSVNIMEKQGVLTNVIRAVDHEIAPGVYHDMREQGWETDEWPELFERVKRADILVLAGPIWLGDNSSEMKKIIERLYAESHVRDEHGQYIFYGKVGGCLITGNEDGLKHCAMNILYSLQHVGCTIPPQADAGWLGGIGPGPSYLDKDADSLENDFTNRNTTFTTWNLMHMAQILKDAGGIPRYGNLPDAWKGGERFGFEQVNS